MSQFEKTRPVSSESVAEMFDTIAGRYDLLNRLLSFYQDVRWRRALLSQIPKRQDGILLDLATGTGDVLFAAAKQHNEYQKFHGVDISQGMLDVAGHKLKGHKNKEKITLDLMNAESLRFDSQTVDTATISFGLRNVVNTRSAVEELHRVLSRDGRLIILEFFPAKNSFLKFIFQIYFHYILPFIGGLLSNREAYEYLPQSVEGFCSINELRKMLFDVGFVRVKSIGFLFGTTQLIIADKEEGELNVTRRS